MLGSSISRVLSFIGNAIGVLSEPESPQSRDRDHGLQGVADL